MNCHQSRVRSLFDRIFGSQTVRAAESSSDSRPDDVSLDSNTVAAALTPDSPNDINKDKTSAPPLHFCASTNDAKEPCNAQWLMLYSYAAYAPESPTKEEQVHLQNFFANFPDQCTSGPAAYCYTRAVAMNPPRLEHSHRERLLWLCSIENRCRKSAEMPTKLCRYKDLMTRWRYPDGYL